MIVDNFVDYVKQKGYSNAEGQIYGDYPQRFEPKEGIDLTKYLKYFPLLKSKEKLYQQDVIWKKICKDLQWEYIPTI